MERHNRRLADEGVYYDILDRVGVPHVVPLSRAWRYAMRTPRSVSEVYAPVYAAVNRRILI